MNRGIDFLEVCITTIVFGAVTYLTIGTPHISFIDWDYISIIAFVLWTFYGTVLYLVVQKRKMGIGRLCLQAVLFGLLTAVAKGIIDFVEAILTANLKSMIMIKVVCIDQIVTFVFGILLMFFLHVVVAKKRILFRVPNVSVPLALLITTLGVYILFIVNYMMQNNKKMISYQADVEAASRFDYFFALKIVDGNTWFYVAFYIFFWWFMERITVERKQEIYADRRDTD